MVGNNEIYNAPELRAQLEKAGHVFSTHSDTEVMVHAWEEWGQESFARLNGMYAIALIDTRKRVTVLARDPLGIKPLHLMKQGRGFAFASEIKSLLTVQSGAKPDLDSLHVFMNLRYLPGDSTLFEGIERVPPGQSIAIDWDTLRETRRSHFDWKAAKERREAIGFDEASEKLHALLDRAVGRHLLSDVEVGAYLSGGMDSSVVASLAGRKISGLRSFCMAFGEPTDENADAKRAADAFGTRHVDFSVAGTALDRYRETLWHVEEPKINCIQGYALAQGVAGNGLKVALSGLGGDELFAGYTNNDILFPMAKIVRFTGNSTSPHHLAWMPRAGRPGDFYLRAGELAENIRNPLQYYAILRNSFDHDPRWLGEIYSKPRESWRNRTVDVLSPYFDRSQPDVMNELLCLEMRTKLINDFLLTEDRVSMAHGLEVRVPFLDRELVQFVLSLPSSFKYRPGQKKRLLKAAMKPELPAWVLAKPKWGFSFNPHLLFKTELKPFAQKILTRERVEEMGLFSWKWIQSVLEAPPHPKMRWHYFNLWVMAGTVIWHDLFFSGKKGNVARDEAS
jgi:asparagine synthase (glutamine-hydrolysing)